MIRHCYLCNAEIHECMGAVLARDLEMWRLGEIEGKQVRELCGKCSLVQSEKGFIDIPFTAREKQLLEGAA